MSPKATTQVMPYHLIARGPIWSAMGSISGIPTKLLDDSQSLSVKEIREFFASRVLGQPEANKTVIDRISLIKAGLNKYYSKMKNTHRKMLQEISEIESLLIIDFLLGKEANQNTQVTSEKKPEKELYGEIGDSKIILTFLYI